MMSGTEIDLSAVRGETSGDSTIAHAAELVEFAEAGMGHDDARLLAARSALERALGPRGVVDTAGVIAAFNVVDRIADATGIPLDEGPTREFREAVGKELGLEDFHPDRRAAR